MPSAIKVKHGNRRSGRLSGQQRPQQWQVPIEIVSVNKNASTMTIVFNQVVTLKGVPQYTTDLPTVHAISAALTSPATLVVTFSAAVTTATELDIPVQDPAIRNAAGGYAYAGTFPVT